LFLPSLVLDRASGVPLHAQVRTQFADSIRREGRSRARLPSTRLLARMLGVSRNTIVTAYEELAADGLIEGRVGSGMVVARQPRGPMGGFDAHRALREAQYPSRTLAFEDPDGSLLYVSY
jgi:GntR family transcriptional regulator/MocR family aminotransferase